jgi:hypothetical protein
VKTRLILKPGQPGTKSLAKKYGDALLCVRFRYDPGFAEKSYRETKARGGESSNPAIYGKWVLE